MSSPPYRIAFLDWLACACAGARENAAVAMRATGADLLADVAFAATAGHVLDYDDTFADGVAHVSAACAPAALVLAAHLELPLHRALAAYAEGFEAMAAIAQASHPALYGRGGHPTAVCGPAGAATAAAALLQLDPEQREQAVALSLLRTGGARWPFGSDGKAIQVGLGAAAGVQAALLARAGARVDLSRALSGIEATVGVRLAAPDPPPTGIERNWIKLHPSCLGTHAPIEAAAQAEAAHAATVVVDPVSRQAAHIDTPTDGLEAKFSIQYCVAHTLLRRPPRLRDFDGPLDPEVSGTAARITVQTDAGLPPFSAVIGPVRVEAAAPAPPDRLGAKLEELAGSRLDRILDDLEVPAARVLEAADLSG